jgi:hypothetical protein
MKILTTLVCILSLLTATTVQGASVTLAWNKSTDPTVAGYRIYEGVASHLYTNAITVGNFTNTTVSGLVNGTTYFFAATCYTTNGL